MRFHAILIRLNNWATRLRGVRAPPERLLLLVAHCLQSSDCGRRVIRDPGACERCGQCQVGELLALRDRYGIRWALVAGGRQALEAVRHPEVMAVVAVACEKELAAGIRAAFPKPVLAAPNRQTGGPCRDARAAADEVEAAIVALLR